MSVMHAKSTVHDLCVGSRGVNGIAVLQYCSIAVLQYCSITVLQYYSDMLDGSQPSVKRLLQLQILPSFINLCIFKISCWTLE